jgi:hypothetical protein
MPEKPNLEMLHEERNNIQHKYANPNADVAAFHVENAMRFVSRFVADELKLDILEYIPTEYLEQLDLLPSAEAAGPADGDEPVTPSPA